jgi:hypothetical protein
MSGFNLIQKVRHLEERADTLGFRFGHAKHTYNNSYGDVIALYPKDEDSLPVFSRDAELFICKFEELDAFFDGIEWARRYDMLLFGDKHNDVRVDKEQKARNRRLMNKIKESE